MTIADLFEPEPHRWGLRGDPHIWLEMRTHFEHTPIPDSVEALVSIIESAFQSLTEHSLSSAESFFIYSQLK